MQDIDINTLIPLLLLLTLQNHITYYGFDTETLYLTHYDLISVQSNLNFYST